MSRGTPTYPVVSSLVQVVRGTPAAGRVPAWDAGAADAVWADPAAGGPTSLGELLALSGDAGGNDITNAGTVAAALLSAGGGGIDADGVYGDGSRLTGLPSSPTPTLASVLAAGDTDGGAGAAFTGPVAADFVHRATAGGPVVIGDTSTGQAGDVVELSRSTVLRNGYGLFLGSASGVQLGIGSNLKADYLQTPAVRFGANVFGWDAGLRRSAANALTIDSDGAGGAADLAVTGVVAAGANFRVGADPGVGGVVSIPDGPTLTFYGGLLIGVAA